jgi:hypothetical protein
MLQRLPVAAAEVENNQTNNCSRAINSRSILVSAVSEKQTLTSSGYLRLKTENFEASDALKRIRTDLGTDEKIFGGVAILPIYTLTRLSFQGSVLSSALHPVDQLLSDVLSYSNSVDEKYNISYKLFPIGYETSAGVQESCVVGVTAACTNGAVNEVNFDRKVVLVHTVENESGYRNACREILKMSF